MAKHRRRWKRMKAANEKKSRDNRALKSTPKLITYFASNVPSTSDVTSHQKHLPLLTWQWRTSSGTVHNTIYGADTDTPESGEPSIGSQHTPNLAEYVPQPQTANIHLEAHDDNQATATTASTDAMITSMSMFSNDPGFLESNLWNHAETQDTD